MTTFSSFFSSLSPEVKKLATLEFANHKEQVQSIKHETMSKLQRHALDCGTSEAMSKLLPKVMF